MGKSCGVLQFKKNVRKKCLFPRLEGCGLDGWNVMLWIISLAVLSSRSIFEFLHHSTHTYTAIQINPLSATKGNAVVYAAYPHRVKFENNEQIYSWAAAITAANTSKPLLPALSLGY